MLKLGLAFWAVTLLNAGGALACATDMVSMTAQQDAGPQAALDGSTTQFAVSEPFDIKIQFCGPQANAIEEVRVAAIMPAHQHGMNYTPEVTSLGDGVFMAAGMLFHMPGVWRIDVSAWGLENPLFYELEVTAQ